MEAWQRAVLRAAVWFILLCVALAVLFGIPESCHYSAGSAYGATPTCQVVGVTGWWDHGARISQSTIQQNMGNGFFSSDIVSHFFSRVFGKLADFGSVIWNPIATYPATRVLLGLLAAALIYDLLKSFLRTIFSDHKTGGD